MKYSYQVSYIRNNYFVFTSTQFRRLQFKPSSGNPSLSESNPQTRPSPMYVGVLHYRLNKCTIDNSVQHGYALTLQSSARHMHGEVLGPLHIIFISLLVVSSHKQLAVESHTN